MPTIYLVLTNPYAYNRALALSIQQAKKANATLNVVFLIDPDAIDGMVRELGDSGWLGGGSRQALYESMLEGYGALAADTIEAVHRQIGQKKEGVSFKTSIRETSIESLLQELLKTNPQRAIVSATPSLHSPASRRDPRVQWIVEN